MDATEALKLIRTPGATALVPVVGALTLAAHKKLKSYEIWVWLDEAGQEHVTKVMGQRRFGWSPDCLQRGFSFIDTNKLPRV